MLPLVAWIVIFIISLAILVKGSDWFTEAAEKLSHKLGISPFIIGVTVVSIGTSLPELASSIAAVLAGESEIVIGNVVGSNIANILLVLGVGAVVAGKLSAKWELRKVDFPVLFGATFLLLLMCFDGVFTLIEAFFMLAGYVLYLDYLHNKNKKKVKKQKVEGAIWVPLLAGGVLIYFGARFTVESVIGIATWTGIPSGVIAVSAVALGTSLPELFVTVTAALKGKHDLALGNIIGSNIFNLFAVMGITGLFGTLLIPTTMLFALAMLVIATFMLYFVTAHDKTITRWEGLLLLLLYAFFVVRLFI